MIPNQSEDFLKNLKALIYTTASLEISCDEEDFSVEDYAGGNYDDAYSMGVQHGEVEFAKFLQSRLISLEQNTVENTEGGSDVNPV
jgi:hypothetical protein